jgi:hypothetical protein
MQDVDQLPTRRARRDVETHPNRTRPVSLADGLILAAVVYAWLVYYVVALLLPSHALLFLPLVLSLLATAWPRRLLALRRRRDAARAARFHSRARAQPSAAAA